MRIRLLFALSGLSGSNGHRRFCVVQTRAGDRTGAHRSVHGFWQGPTADLPDADRDNNRPQHIPPSTLRARLHMSVHEADEHARATQPLVERRVTQQKQRLSRCQLCRIYGHDASTRNVRSAASRDYSQRSRPLKNGEGLPAAYEGGRKQPHPFHHLPPILTGIAPCRRHFIRYFESPETIDEKGNGAYPQRNSTVVRRTSDIPALDQLYEGSERGGSRDVGAVNVAAENDSSGQFTAFCCTHKQPINAESCAAFLAAIVCVAPSTRRQHARMLRSMLQMDRTPLGMAILGLQKIAAR
ncbi:selenocysteine-tRNA-specific elongation factor [Trypanosoma cruzi]|nr:selenocysteine-tRNA-specific elongation factor [Trypanosoma cruzi]